MAQKSKLVHKKFIEIASENNHIKFLKLLNLLDPIKLTDRSNHELSLKLFIIRTVKSNRVLSCQNKINTKIISRFV